MQEGNLSFLIANLLLSFKSIICKSAGWSIHYFTCPSSLLGLVIPLVYMHMVAVICTYKRLF
jgi:hypothetical protein